MPARIKKYSLNLSTTKQSVDMPRRARVLHVYIDDQVIVIDAVQDEDNDTKAFDVNNQRYFEVVTTNGWAPEGSHVGSVSLVIGKGSKAATKAFHVYEVRSR